MSDVFISYSRENKAFVRRLHDALIASNTNTWVDWEDIPPSARWMDEIHCAIIDADAFLFVISPASAASRTCAWEVSIAAENNKRIVPIVCLSADPSTLPPAIGALNWVLATDADDFATALARLTESIRVDLEHVRSHSRLLNRAHEWRNGSSETSLLLRGWDLDEAERWLASADAKEPPPTALQRDYVACGRWAARLAESDVLARQSQLHASLGRYQTAAAHLLRAIELAPKGGAPAAFPVSELMPGWAADAWFRYRYLDRKRGRLIRRLAAQGTGITCLARSSDGDAVLTGGFDGALRLWLVSTGELLSTLPGHRGAIASVAFVPDRMTAWSSAEDGQVLVWSLETGAVAPRFPKPIDPATAIVFNGSRVALGLRSGFVMVFDHEAGTVYVDEQLHSGAVTAVVFAPGDVLFSGSARPVIGEWLGDGSVLATSLADGKSRLALPGTLNPVSSLAISANGRRVLRGMRSGVLEVWDLDPDKSVMDFKSRDLAGHNGPVVALAIAADPNVAYSGGEDRTVRMWNLEAGEERRVFDGHGDIVTAILAADGAAVMSGAIDETVAIWDLETAEDFRAIDTGDIEIDAIAFSADGQRAVTGSAEGTIDLWDTQTHTHTKLSTASSSVAGVAVSADGSLAVSGMLSGVAFVWDVATRRRCATLLAQAAINAVALSPDASTVATASEDKTIRLWNTTTGAAMAVLAGHGDTVLNAVFHPGGRELVSTSRDGTARVWDAPTGRELRQITLPDGASTGLAFVPDGKTVLIAGATGSIQVCAYDTGQFVRSLTGHVRLVWTLATSPDGRLALSGSLDHTVRVWDLATGACCRIGEGHSEPVGGVAFAPDGHYGISAAMDGTIRLWQLDGDGTKAIDVNDEGLRCLAVSARHRTLVTGGDDAVTIVWDLSTLKPVARLQEGHTADVYSVAFSADGSSIVSGSKDRTGRVWDVATGVQTACFLEGGESITGAAFVAGTDLVLTASGDRFKEIEDRKVFGAVGGKRMDTEKGRGLVLLWNRADYFGWPLEHHTRSLDGLAIDNEGQRFVSGSADGSVRLWDVDSGAQLRLFTGHTSAVTCVALSADRRKVAAAGANGVIRVWDADRLDPAILLEGHQKGIGELAFLPAGDRLLSVSGDRSVRLWALATRSARVLHDDLNETSIAVSGDGSIAVTGSYDGPIHVWDLATGTLRQTLRDHASTVWNVAVNADGTRALSVSTDQTLRLWDLATGKTVKVIPTPQDSTVGVRFGADGATGIAIFGDGLARVWDLTTGELLRTWSDPERPPSTIAVSPDGRWAVSASRSDGSLTIGALGSPDLRRLPVQGPLGDVLSVACSPDGSRALLAGVDGTIRVWDIRAGRRLPSLCGHGAAVTSLAFDGTGRVLVSASMDGTVRVWNMTIGQPAQILVGHTAPVLGVALTPDGRVAVSVADDNTARLWDVRSGAELDAIASHGASSVAIDPKGEEVWLGSRGRLSVWQLADPRTPAEPPSAAGVDPGVFNATIQALQQSIGLRVNAAGRLELV
jgi:WD40 repeat protein